MQVVGFEDGRLADVNGMHVCTYSEVYIYNILSSAYLFLFFFLWGFRLHCDVRVCVCVHVCVFAGVSWFIGERLCIVAESASATVLHCQQLIFTPTCCSPTLALGTEQRNGWNKKQGMWGSISLPRKTMQWLFMALCLCLCVFMAEQQRSTENVWLRLWFHASQQKIQIEVVFSHLQSLIFYYNVTYLLFEGRENTSGTKTLQKFHSFIHF